jgi:hypothetical protein
MAMALIGALLAPLILGRIHDRQIQNLMAISPSGSTY